MGTERLTPIFSMPMALVSCPTPWPRHPPSMKIKTGVSEDSWSVPRAAAMTRPSTETVALMIRTPAIGVALRIPWRIAMRDAE